MFTDLIDCLLNTKIKTNRIEHERIRFKNKLDAVKNELHSYYNFFFFLIDNNHVILYLPTHLFIFTYYTYQFLFN